MLNWLSTELKKDIYIYFKWEVIFSSFKVKILFYFNGQLESWNKSGWLAYLFEIWLLVDLNLIFATRFFDLRGENCAARAVCGLNHAINGA